MRTSMTVRTVRNEYAKMRHLRIGLITALLLLGVCALTVLSALSSGLVDHRFDADGDGWRLLMASLHGAVGLTSPLLLAVMASRQVEVEHSGQGWMSSATAGTTPGRLCRVKLLALGLLILPIPAAWGALVVIVGRAVGLTAPVPVPRLLALVASLAVINLAVLGAQLLASARVENQLGPLALGLIGILLSVFAPVMPLWARYLSPWTAYGLIVPADFAGTDLVDLDTHLVGLTVLTGVGGALFALVTSCFDHQEV